MKNAQPKKATIGKISWFLRSVKSAGSSKDYVRRSIRGGDEYPNSSKIGKGTHYINRGNRNVLQRSDKLLKIENNKGRRIENEIKDITK